MLGCTPFHVGTLLLQLEAITRAIFHPDDDPILSYLEEDGCNIEPEVYAPIIPMALVNGCNGIATGCVRGLQGLCANPGLYCERVRSMILLVLCHWLQVEHDSSQLQRARPHQQPAPPAQRAGAALDEPVVQRV